MGSSITDEQIQKFRDVIAKYEPYPLSILDDVMFDESRYDEQRLNATYAKEMLVKHGIPITNEPAQQ